jgi:hypothetical protein
LKRRRDKSKNRRNTIQRIDRKDECLLYFAKPLKKSEYPFMVFRTESRRWWECGRKRERRMDF